MDEDKNIVNQTKQALLETVNKIELTAIDILCQWLSIYIYIVLSVFIIIFIDNKYNCKPVETIENKKDDIVVKYGIKFKNDIKLTWMYSSNNSVIINNTNYNLSIFNMNSRLNLFVYHNDKRIAIIEYTNNYEGNKLQYTNKFIERCDYEREKNNEKMENDNMETEENDEWKQAWKRALLNKKKELNNKGITDFENDPEFKHLLNWKVEMEFVSLRKLREKEENNHMEKEDVIINVDKIFNGDFNFCNKNYRIYSSISTYTIDFTGIEYPYYWIINTNKPSNSHKYVKNSSIRIGQSSWDYHLLFKDDKLVGYLNKKNNIQHVLLM